jgi:hypothetical protein
VIAAAEDAVTICGSLGESRAPFVFAARAWYEPGCSRRGLAVATVGLAAVGGRACLVPMPARLTRLPAPGPCLPFRNRWVPGYRI